MNGANRLFVYGTLLESAEHPMGQLLRAHAHLLGTGSIQARLYMIDDPDAPGENFYPGAVPSPDVTDRVYGEIYDVSDPGTVFPAFDRYEACSADFPEPHEFLLRSVPVTLADGQTLLARSYLYTWDVAGAARIASGRYTDRNPDVR